MNIIFTDIVGIPKEYYPVPASKNIPEWYKNLESFVGGEKKPNEQGDTTGTIKRCMPVFDVLTSGYIIFSHADLYISQKKLYKVDPETKEETIIDPDKNHPSYQYRHFDIVGFHPIVQAPTYPKNHAHELSYPKWMNPFGIKTPPGYSCLFVQPFHRESVFNILPGIVDTDKYTAPVNFPFTLNEKDFEGLIPAGTPIAQVIPFKRDNWKMTFGGEKEIKEQQEVTKGILAKIFDGYKNKHREIKEYK